MRAGLGGQRGGRLVEGEQPAGLFLVAALALLVVGGGGLVLGLVVLEAGRQRVERRGEVGEVAAGPADVGAGGEVAGCEALGRPGECADLAADQDVDADPGDGDAQAGRQHQQQRLDRREPVPGNQDGRQG